MSKRKKKKFSMSDAVDNALLQDKLDAAMEALRLSLEDHYSGQALGMVMKLIEDIWRMVQEQEHRNMVQ
jgi:hypothetical protein